jgi:hypothetical protein
MDTRQHLKPVDRLADESLCAGMQCPFPVRWLAGNHENRDHGFAFSELPNLSQAFHDLESIHQRHDYVKQNEVIAIRAMQVANRPWIRGKTDCGVSRVIEHASDQLDVLPPIVHDQYLRIQNAGSGDQGFALLYGE